MTLRAREGGGMVRAGALAGKRECGIYGEWGVAMVENAFATLTGLDLPPPFGSDTPPRGVSDEEARCDACW